MVRRSLTGSTVISSFLAGFVTRVNTAGEGSNFTGEVLHLPQILKHTADHADLTHREFGRPVGVTEFNPSTERLSDVEMLAYIMQATDYMERSPFVQGYAFFKEQVVGHPKASLLAEEPGKLTPWGAAYVAIPVHDTGLYYRIRGRLPAENYVAMNKMDIRLTSDDDGPADMVSNEEAAWTDYNLQVDNAASYTLRLRGTGQTGKIRVFEGTHLPAEIPNNPVQGKWETVQAEVKLPTGPQTLRIRYESTS